VEGAPFHCDFAVADTEKAPEIDDRGTHEAAAINDYVDNATHIFVGGAQNFTPKNASGFIALEYGDRWRLPYARWRMVGGLTLSGSLGICWKRKRGRAGGNENYDCSGSDAGHHASGRRNNIAAPNTARVWLFLPLRRSVQREGRGKSHIASAIQKIPGTERSYALDSVGLVIVKGITFVSSC
jgi:hypothetical protein